MSSLKSDLQIEPQELFSSSTVQLTNLGSRVTTGDGRYFRYCLAGGTALVPGKLQQGTAEDTSNWENLAVAAAAAGSYTVTTTSTVTLAANLLAGGWLNVTVTPGVGYQYKIASHPAASAAVVTFTLEDPIIVALTTSSKIDVIPSPYQNVIVNPATATGAPVGVAVYAIPSASYGWIQTSGPANVLADGTIVVGTQVVASNGTAGAIEPQVAGASSVIQALVGTAITGIATTEYGLINLNLV